jgi:hypothetical protein
MPIILNKRFAEKQSACPKQNPPGMGESRHGLPLYNTHGHELRIPCRKKAQFVTALGITHDF